MCRTSTTLVMGIGSHHGDDGIGWAVIDQLIERPMDGVCFVKAQVPLDLLDTIDEVSEVHLVDAAVGLDPSESLLRLNYSIPFERAALGSISMMGTHGMSVTEVLRIAESLGVYTGHVTIWLCKGQSYQPFEELSEVARQSVSRCVSELVKELRSARTVAR